MSNTTAPEVELGFSGLNSRGYPDSTACRALRNVQRAEYGHRPLIYICSPYSGNVIANVELAREFFAFAVTMRVIPLARDINAEEYVPFARMLAKHIGIEWADDSTYDPERLMYWPSTARDGVFFHDRIPGAWFDPDKVLAEFDDWRDASTWPTSSRQGAQKAPSGRKLGDPHEKAGLVGAFCRAYNIPDAIDTFLSDVYEPTTHPGRFTYTQGESTGGSVVFDERFAYSFHGTVPWSGYKQGWTDNDDAALRVYLERRFDLYAPTRTRDALRYVSASRSYHPVRDWLGQLPEWDETPRVETLLIDYFGAADTAYSRAVIRKTLTAAVARVFTPGTKFDSVLILNGPQGIGKSTFFARLAGAWFSDSLTLTDMKDKAGAEKLQGNWIVELSELAGIRKVELESMKSFLSRTDGKFRAAYGTVVESHPRQCVIVGSTNAQDGFLRDLTGNRRFWPVTCTDTATR